MLQNALQTVISPNFDVILWVHRFRLRTLGERDKLKPVRLSSWANAGNPSLSGA